VNSMQDAHNQADSERTDQHREEVIARLAAIEILLTTQQQDLSGIPLKINKS